MSIQVEVFFWEGSGDSRRWPVWLRERRPHFVPDEGRLYVGGVCVRRGDIIVLDGERIVAYREA